MSPFIPEFAVDGLRLTRVSVPVFRKKGESALLECKYELKKLHNFRLPHGLDHGMEPEDATEDEVDRDEPEEEADELNEFLDSGELLERHRQPLRRRTQASLGHHVVRTEDLKYYETSEALYSVKWYKDNEEFYRYLPKSNPPQHSYRVEGIRVDVSRTRTEQQRERPRLNYAGAAPRTSQRIP